MIYFGLFFTKFFCSHDLRIVLNGLIKVDSSCFFENSAKIETEIIILCLATANNHNPKIRKKPTTAIQLQ